MEAALARRLVAAAAELQGESVGDPELVAELQNTLAISLINLGFAREAIPLLEEALETHQAKLGPDDLDTLSSMNNLAVAYRDAGQLDQALPLLEEAAQGMEKRKFQSEYARQIIAVTTNTYEAAGKWEQAERWRRKWLVHLKATGSAGSATYAEELAALGRNPPSSKAVA